MSHLEYIFIAFGLAMDAFAVSIVAGCHRNVNNPRAYFRISFHFGLFQALMPVIGWFLASRVSKYMQPVDHWIAFILLAIIGGKMIYEYIHAQHDEFSKNPSKGMRMVMLSIATSIDALAIGITLAMLNVSIIYPAILIGLITGALSLVGVLSGERIKEKFGRVMELIGGIVLIFIGIKILIEHMFLN